MLYEAMKRLHSGCISARHFFPYSFGFIFKFFASHYFPLYNKKKKKKKKIDRTLFVSTDTKLTRAHDENICYYFAWNTFIKRCNLWRLFFFSFLRKTNFTTHTQISHYHFWTSSFCRLAISWSKVICNSSYFFFYLTWK